MVVLMGGGLMVDGVINFLIKVFEVLWKILNIFSLAK